MHNLFLFFSLLSVIGALCAFMLGHAILVIAMLAMCLVYLVASFGLRSRSSDESSPHGSITIYPHSPESRQSAWLNQYVK